MATKGKAEGPSLIDIARAHYEEKREAVVVPEWGDITVYYAPVTYADMDALEARNPATNLERNVLLLIAKTVDADGKQMFRWGDAHHLMANVDQAVLTRLAQTMMGVGVADEAMDTDEAVGKSEAGEKTATD